MIATLWLILGAIGGGLYAFSGSLATTGLIVLGWLAAGFGIGLLMARFR